MTVRIALALLAIVSAAMAYPWQTTTDRWVLGVAAAVVLLAFARWRGLFLTTMTGRCLAVWRRNRGGDRPPPSSDVTVLLRVEAPAGVPLPLPAIAAYVDRFGIRATTVRVTGVDDGQARTTWVAMTFGAAANLAALLARSPELPLRDTAEVVGRRLADHLREAGLDAAIVDAEAGPLTGRGHETWRAVRDDRGHVACYRLPVDDRLGDRLAEVWSQTAVETWTALEFGGTATALTVTAVCAVRSDEAPKRPPAGLRPLPGLQRPTLTALGLGSTERLGADAVALPAGLLDRVAWPVEGTRVRGGPLSGLGSL